MESALFQSIIAASLWNNLPDQIRTRACLSSYIRIELRLFFKPFLLDFSYGFFSNLVKRHWLTSKNGAI